MEAIARESIIADVIQRYPESQTVFERLGMGCLVCMGAMEETVESGARMHGIDVQRLLVELNRVARSVRDQHSPY